ncbi:MAG TPA: hypothetical protein DCG19_11430 [Cryomorphaceae bacterium]|nr:hypothetical protein [Owenweeksia sp.]HAD98009.1 hypothetical protein [Cryomorphaceae bacterium]HBF21087.1 hypothetical protein [Cryomorphaceae bacterium]HCQ15134.1 hypothetical protein [Cryomorphaceae bacterium]|tara:strand:- start:349 stop:909 length:561 start_codon:yes stop_codon:yes gene_type:complete
MKSTIFILINLILLVRPVLSQDTILGYYTYQTGATERIGGCLDLRPNKTFILSSIRYRIISPIDSGQWRLSGDTVMLESMDSLFYLKSITEFNLRTFLPDSIDSESPVAWLIPTHWTKTRSYYQNGQIKSTMSWTSISRFYHESIPHGLWVTYYENGNLKEIGKYKKGRKKGKWYYLWPDGKEKNN